MMCWAQVTAWRAARFASETALRQQVGWVERPNPNEIIGFMPAIPTDTSYRQSPRISSRLQKHARAARAKNRALRPEKLLHLEEFVYSTCDWYSSVRASPRR